MSDILLHAAIVENQKTFKEYIDFKSGGVPSINGLDFFTINTRPGWPIRDLADWKKISITTCPDFVVGWKKYLSPITCPRTCGFKVCNTGNSTGGADCTWVVPAGVTEVQIQLWAPGTGNSGQCCCGGTPPGVTGSYMVSNIPISTGAGAVCTGSTFCLRAGCINGCYATQTTPAVTASNTCVCVSNVYSAWTEFGTFGFAGWLNDVYNCNLRFACNPNGMLPSGDTCGPDACSGWNFCWDSGNDDTYTPHAFSSRTWWVHQAPTDSKHYGIPAIYGAIIIPSGTMEGSCAVTGPVFGFENCTCMSKWSNENNIAACSRSWDNGYQQIPAVGGYPTFVSGGWNACGGDSGTKGMICVSWNV